MGQPSEADGDVSSEDEAQGSDDDVSQSAGDARVDAPVASGAVRRRTRAAVPRAAVRPCVLDQVDSEPRGARSESTRSSARLLDARPIFRGSRRLSGKKKSI